MMMYLKYLRVLKNPLSIIRILGNRNFFNWLDDKIYLKLLYRAETGKRLDLKNPRTFNEKLQWLKLYDRKMIYNELADKYKVRSYVKEKIGENYLIPLIGVYEDVEEIDWEQLPSKFVLKCTHGSGTNIICTDKSKLNISETKKKLKKWMKKNWYWFGREWCYKYIEPKIICEKYLVDESGTQLKDYKFFCFNGEPKLIQVDIDRFKNHKRNLYTTNWEFIEATIQYPNAPFIKISKPEKLEEMLSLAKKLSQDFPHVRVDFYYIRGKIYFGEMTFYHGSGFEKFTPNCLEKKMGDWLRLPM